MGRERTCSVERGVDASKEGCIIDIPSRFDEQDAPVAWVFFENRLCTDFSREDLVFAWLRELDLVPRNLFEYGLRMDTSVEALLSVLVGESKSVTMSFFE